jgi:hypothetical protein
LQGETAGFSLQIPPEPAIHGLTARKEITGIRFMFFNN